MDTEPNEDDELDELDDISSDEERDAAPDGEIEHILGEDPFEDLDISWMTRDHGELSIEVLGHDPFEGLDLDWLVFEEDSQLLFQAQQHVEPGERDRQPAVPRIPVLAGVTPGGEGEPAGTVPPAGESTAPKPSTSRSDFDACEPVRKRTVKVETLFAMVTRPVCALAVTVHTPVAHSAESANTIADARSSKVVYRSGVTACSRVAPPTFTQIQLFTSETSVMGQNAFGFAAIGQASRRRSSSSIRSSTRAAFAARSAAVSNGSPA